VPLGEFRAGRQAVTGRELAGRDLPTQVISDLEVSVSALHTAPVLIQA
jgi:hypothetical protein